MESSASGTSSSVTNSESQKPSKIDLTGKNTYSANHQNENEEIRITEVSVICNQESNQIKENGKTHANNQYRCGSDSWSDDDEDSSSSSDTSSDSEFYQIMIESAVPKQLPAIKTKGELGMDDLPPIEDLAITVKEEEMTLVGKIHAVVEKLVVIHAIKDEKPLDLDSVLFLSHDKPLGRVFDVFGPVVEPFYCVRFNSTEDIKNKGIEIGADVFFVPEKTDLTSYVFVDELQKQKGSDASWKYNNEPPEECIDFSDDEKEKAARQKRSAKNRNRQFNNPEVSTKRLASAASPSVQSNFSSRTSSPDNNIAIFSARFPRRNPFSSTQSSQSPAAPPRHRLQSAAIRGPSVRSVPPTQQLAFTLPQRSFPQQSLLQRPSSPLVFTSFPPPPVFGQVALLSPVPASMAPLAPPPFANSIPNGHLHANPQNYFNQRFATNQPPPPLQHAQFAAAPNLQMHQGPMFASSPSPSPQPMFLTGHNPLQLNQRFQPTVPVSLHQSPSPNPWPPMRAPTPPIHPLNVQIPHQNGPPPAMNTFQLNGLPFQPFVNNANVNMNNGNMLPRFY